jgi:3-hydroxyisobutyrate dehydrogenase-like beta-hydroxyacid dehydrogenase
MPITVGIVHPGEMGSAIGACLAVGGHQVIWAPAGRSAATAQRASAAGLADVGTLDRLVSASDVVISVCPPDAASAVGRELRGFRGVFVEANAVSPRTLRDIAAVVTGAGASAVVDGGIVGPPPRTSSPGATRLYLAGSEAPAVSRLFDSTPVEVRVIVGDLGAASALKMTYAAWTKGSAALLLAIRAAARASRVEADLLREWSESQPDLLARTQQAARSAATKGWRWVGEMEEVAATFADADLPEGFHRAAAEIYRRSVHLDAADPRSPTRSEERRDVDQRGGSAP